MKVHPAITIAKTVDDAGDTTLRGRQAELTKELILRAFAELLAEHAPQEISTPELARRAGVSLRTAYRHFPGRGELLVAAGEWINRHAFGGNPLPQTLDDMAAGFERDCAKFAEYPNLVRAMVFSQAGSSVRSPRRARRIEAITRVLGEAIRNLPRSEIRRAAAVIAYLDNMLAWITLRDESGLDDKEAGRAVAWAIRTLIDDLRRRNAAVRRHNPA